MKPVIRNTLWICWAIVSISLGVWFIVAPPFKHPFHQELGSAAIVVEPLMALQPFCALWMAIKAFRDEENPVPYIAVSLIVPLGWLWYYVERVRPRVQERSGSHVSTSCSTPAIDKL